MTTTVRVSHNKGKKRDNENEVKQAYYSLTECTEKNTYRMYIMTPKDHKSHILS